jgi:broad specificity phosphatase PhoE
MTSHHPSLDQLLLVRHGETVHNVAGIAQGWNDSALSERGARQVSALARRLANLGVTALYSSPLERAMTTALAISDATALPIITLDDLREMNYGTWEGQSFLAVRRADEEIYRRWIADPDVACPNGESHNDVLRRVRNAFASIPMEGRVVIVTHGTAIRIGATALLQLPVTAARLFAQDNASVNVFIRRGERFVLKVWNDTSHCESGQ